MVFIWFLYGVMGVFPQKLQTSSDMFTHTVDGSEILHHLGLLKPYK